MSCTFRGDSLPRKFRSDDVCVSCWGPSADLALCVTIACSIRQIAPQGCAHGQSHCLGAVITSDADISGSMAASMSSRSTESEPSCIMQHTMQHKPTAMLMALQLAGWAASAVFDDLSADSTLASGSLSCLFSTQTLSESVQDRAGQPAT